VWSSNSCNAVGAEYIIEEKADGVPLGTLWNSWSHTARLDMLKEIINIEAKLASLSFAKHRCIYFWEDLE